ncbi:MAG: hypothetical protein AAF390_09225 [Pseudomonadota bacterium]
MASQLDDQAQTRLALAALNAALVRTLHESGAISAQDYLGNLERIYGLVRDRETSSVELLETLNWTREILKDIE